MPTFYLRELPFLFSKNGLSLAACVPVTGRTHQIRVHFASIGHPLAGDDLYGGSRARIGRQALHCAKQTFWVPRCERMPDGIRIELTDKAFELLANVGFDPVYGARPLKRAIQQQLENPLAQAILSGGFGSGDTVRVDAEGGKLVFVAGANP